MNKTKELQKEIEKLPPRDCDHAFCNYKRNILEAELKGRQDVLKEFEEKLDKVFNIAIKVTKNSANKSFKEYDLKKLKLLQNTLKKELKKEQGE